MNIINVVVGGHQDKEQGNECLLRDTVDVKSKTIRRQASST